MAKIILGRATAHGPQITLPPDAWDLRVEADRQNKDLWFRGKKYDFDQLVEMRRSEKLDEKAAPGAKQGHFDRCQVALEEMVRVYAEAKPDVAVIFGNDQAEIFTETNIPAFAIYWGATIANVAKTQRESRRWGKESPLRRRAIVLQAERNIPAIRNSDEVIPNVPVLINTHNPPNRPSMGRCMDMGKALAEAIAS